jgi:hypothetical protein
MILALPERAHSAYHFSRSFHFDYDATLGAIHGSSRFHPTLECGAWSSSESLMRDTFLNLPGDSGDVLERSLRLNSGHLHDRGPR